MKIIITYSITLILLFLCSCNAAFHNKQNLQDENESVTLTNWQYFEGVDEPDSTGWKNIGTLTELPEVYTENSLWLRTILPEWKGNSPALYVGQVGHFMQVSLNNKMIYKLGDSSSFYFKRIIGWNQNLIELPYFKEGDVITFLIRVENKSVNNLGIILLGSTGEIIKKVFIYSFNNLFFSVFSFIAGIIIFVISISIFKSKLLIGIGVLLTSLAVFMASNSLFLQLIFKAPVLFYQSDYISFMVNTASGFFVIEQIIGEKFKKVLRTIWIIHLAILTASLLIINLTGITYIDIVPWFLAILTFNIVTSFVFMILSTRTGNYESKLLFAGMTGFFIFALLEIFYFIMTEPTSEFGYNVRFLHFGILWFVFSLIRIEMKRYKDTLKQKETARLNELEAIKRENEVRQHFAMKLMQSQENERNRIALELHDSIGQKLLLIKNQLLTNIRKEPELSKSESLKKISDLTGETIQEIRDISWDLRPQHLDQLGLTTAIETLVEKVGESSGIKFNLKTDNIDDLIPKENEINLFRIIQESLNNIVKHSRATEAFISIKRNNNMFHLEIKDNGIGMNRAVKTEGLGLTGMHERAGILGTELNIDFSETSGTSINMEYQSQQVIK